MKYNMLSQAAKSLAAKKRRKRWHRAVSLMAAVVVFVTTYALILPAITMERPQEYTLTAEVSEGVTVMLTGVDDSFPAKAEELTLTVEELTESEHPVIPLELQQEEPEESVPATATEESAPVEEETTPGTEETLPPVSDETADTELSSVAPDVTPEEPEKLDLPAAQTAPFVPDRALAALKTMDTALQQMSVPPMEKRLFDVRLWQGETEVEPVGPVSLTFVGLGDPEATGEARVYHIDEEKQQAVDMPAVLQEDGSIAVQTDHFSLYGVALMPEVAAADAPAMNISVNVVWNGGTPPAGSTVQLELRRNGAMHTTITLPAPGGAWSTNLTGLPEGEYTLVETSAPTGYSGTVTEATQPNGTHVFTVTNTKLPIGDLTLNVQKTWAGGTVGASSVTFALLANGQRFMPDQTVTVNAAGQWKGSFTNLPENDAQGNAISYSVYEIPVAGWTPSMEVTSVPRQTAMWSNVPNTTSSLTNGTIYRFVIGTGTSARALAWNGSDNNLTPATLSNTSTAQQWEWVSSGSYLRNVADTNRRIRITTSGVTAPTNNATSLTQAWNNGTVRFYGGSRYITMTTSVVGVTSSASSGTYFTPQTFSPAVSPRLDFVVTNHRVQGPGGDISFPHYKQIDSLADGVANPHTSLAGDDFYRLYLDARTKGQPIDLVLVVDRSTSMSYYANGTSATNGSGPKRDVAVRDLLNGTGGEDGFIKRFLALNEQNNMAIVWFGGQSYTPQQTALRNVTESGVVKGWTQDQSYTVIVDNNNPNASNNVGYKPNNGTNYMAGMWEAADMLRSDPVIAANNHKKMVIFLTDGIPTFYVVRSSSNSTTATYAEYTAWKANNRPSNGLYRQGTGGSTSSNPDNNKQPAKTAFTDFMTNNPGTTFSSIMFAPTSEDTDVLSNMVANGGKMTQTQGSENLAAVFADLIASITFSKNFSITDSLSQHVEWYAPQPDFKIVRTNLLTGAQDILWQSTGPVTAGTIGAPTAKNDVVQDGIPIKIIESVTYNPSIATDSTGMVRVLFTQEYKVDISNKYTLSFNVKTTPAAYRDFAVNKKNGDVTGYGEIQGDPGTDFSSNQTSSGKPGFHANQSAILKYRYEELFYEDPYDHPVVQVSSASLPLRKTDITGNQLLSGARFELYLAEEQPDGMWVKEDEAPYTIGTTDSAGRLTFNGLFPGKYLLYETQAPEEYRLPEQPWKITVNTSMALTVEGLTAGGDGFYTITNRRLTSQLTVEKKWLNPDGSEKTEGLPGQVDIELWRKWTTGDVENHTVNFYVRAKTSDRPTYENFLIRSQQVSSGGFVTFHGYIWAVPTKVTSNGTTLTAGSTRLITYLNVPIFTLNNITSGQEVVFEFSNQDFWSGALPQFVFSIEDFTPPSGEAHRRPPQEALVETVTLNAANGWKKEWDWGTLPAKDGDGNSYYYYVEEINPPNGFQVSYTNNGGVTSGSITVTNQTSFVLPETGGTGTIPYTMAGALLMLSAGLMYRKKLFRKGGRNVQRF